MSVSKVSLSSSDNDPGSIWRASAGANRSRKSGKKVAISALKSRS
jgi:hypothetical protein